MNTETTTPRTHMFFDANAIMPEADPADKCEACVQAAIEFALENGVKPEDAAKMRDVLVGRIYGTQMVPGPLALVRWRFYMCNVNALVRKQDAIWQALSGKLSTTGRNGASYDITLRESSKDDPQITFAMSVEKKGSVIVSPGGEVAEQNYFWTYSAVTCQTQNQTHNQTKQITAGLPLSIALDVNATPDASGRGNRLSARWSRRLYVSQETNQLSGQIETVNRLNTLVFGTNVEQVVLGAMTDAGFPVHTARVIQPSNGTGNRWTPQAPRQPARTLVATVAGPPPSISTDPFADATA